MHSRWWNRLAIAAAVALFVAWGSAAGAQDAPEDGPGFGGREFPGIRGTVTAAAGPEFTLKTEEGATYKVETGANTRFTKQRQPIKAADVHIGDMIFAIGEVDEKAHSVGAAVLAVVDPEQVKRMRESLGKTWIVGSITAVDMDALKITVKRPDGQTQTIAVDENTSFRRHRESITLADIKVGDELGGQGAVAGGVFVAKELRIGERGEMRGVIRPRGGARAAGSGGEQAPVSPRQ